jgi:membrane-bound ClpP family serine protease
MMESNEPLPPTPVSSGNERTFAIISLVLGVLNLCAWIFPICGFPLGIAGVVLGYLGLKAPEQKNLAIAGMALSGLGILLACVNAIVGVVFAPELEQMFQRMF